MDREALRRRLKAKMDPLVDELLASAAPPQTIDEIEAAALRLREKAGPQVAQELAQAAEEQAQEKAGSSQKSAGSCGRFARHRGERERDVVPRAGRLRVRRSYYDCRMCDAGRCPTDPLRGLGEGPFTRRGQQEVVRLDARVASEKAVELLYELTGVSVSAKAAQRMLSRGDEVLESSQQRRGEVAAEGLRGGKGGPQGLYLLADGVQTPILGGGRERKGGRARGVDAAGKGLGSPRSVSLRGEAEPFGWEWAARAEGAGGARARRVVVLGAGARWIWNQAALHFPEAIQILAVWHASERLWEIGRLAFSEEGGRGSGGRRVWTSGGSTRPTHCLRHWLGGLHRVSPRGRKRKIPSATPRTIGSGWTIRATRSWDCRWAGVRWRVRASRGSRSDCRERGCGGGRQARRPWRACAVCYWEGNGTCS